MTGERRAERAQRRGRYRRKGVGDELHPVVRRAAQGNAIGAMTEQFVIRRTKRSVVTAPSNCEERCSNGAEQASGPLVGSLPEGYRAS